jgi:4'-phosphopantetheinyl transferase
MVAIAGTIIPPTLGAGGEEDSKPQVGIDITCVNERPNRSGELRSLASLHKYIDIFTEVFSADETGDMRRLHGAPTASNTSAGTADDNLIDYGYRLFYTYWALKEAYIKMTGEALLAPWLRELEFSNVIAPGAESGEGTFGEPYTGVRTTLNKEVVEGVRIEVVALEKDYLLATAARGGGIGAGSQSGDGEDAWMPFEKLDIERDIRPCATGVCDCLPTV